MTTSASTPAPNGIAFQLVAALERYEQHSAQLVMKWLDTDLYRTVSAELDEIQRHATSLPGISVAAVALLIAHSQLFSSLWRSHTTREGVPAHELAQRWDEHRSCTDGLRRACLRQLLKSSQ